MGLKRDLQEAGFDLDLVEQRISPLAVTVSVYHLRAAFGSVPPEVLRLGGAAFRRILDRFYIPDPPDPGAATALFDAIAVEYDRLIDRSRNVANIQRLLCTLLTQVSDGLTKPLRVLDFGCGTGLSIIAAGAEPACAGRIRLIGTDSSPTMLHLASARGLKVIAYRDWLAGLGGPFDGAIASYVLHCGLRDDEWAAMRDQLRPGALLAANYHHADDGAVRRVAGQAEAAGLDVKSVGNVEGDGSRNPLLVFRRR